MQVFGRRCVSAVDEARASSPHDLLTGPPGPHHPGLRGRCALVQRPGAARRGRRDQALGRRTRSRAGCALDSRDPPQPTGTSPCSSGAVAGWWPRRLRSPARSWPRASPRRGTDLVLQACRISGSGRGVRIELDSEPVPAGRPEKVSLVRVSTPTRDRKDELNRLGLDVTEHGGNGLRRASILHGADDARTLREAKFSFSVDVPDLAARDIRDRAADARYRRADAGLGAAERPHHLPPPGRLQRGPQAAGARAPGPRAADHAAAQDVEGRPRRGRRDHHRARTTCATASPSSCRWACTTRASGPRASTRWSGPSSWSRAIARGDARDQAAGRDRAHDRRPDRQPRRLQRLARGRRA